ncbi:MAG: hypothetical protein R3264_12635, partial [Anaerolineae bacterium]|nr:hypothetical protein [Anaerolineae bacterium]
MKVAFIVPNFPKLSETFIVSKFVGLHRQGADVHVVCQKTHASEMRHFSDLQHRSTRNRIHQTWPVKPYWLSAVLLVPLVIR